MHHPNKRRQAGGRAAAQPWPHRFDAARDSRCALALLALIGLATLSVIGTTTALSQGHAGRIAAVWRL